MCLHCEECFFDKYALRSHVKLHLIRDHKCRKCNLSFLKEEQLEEHVKSLHVNGIVPAIANRPDNPIRIIARSDYAEPNNMINKRLPHHAYDLIQKNVCETPKRTFYGHPIRYGDVVRVMYDKASSELEIPDVPEEQLEIPDVPEEPEIDCYQQEIIDIINDFFDEVDIEPSVNDEFDDGEPIMKKHKPADYCVRDDFIRSPSPDNRYDENADAGMKEYIFEERDFKYRARPNDYSHYELKDHNLYVPEDLKCVRECTQGLSIICPPPGVDTRQIIPRINGKPFRFNTSSKERTLIALITVKNKHTTRDINGIVRTSYTSTTSATDPRILPRPPGVGPPPPAPRVRIDMKMKAGVRYVFNLLFNDFSILPPYELTFYTEKKGKYAVLPDTKGPWRAVDVGI